MIPSNSRSFKTDTQGFWHITVRFGFIEIPDLPTALKLAKDCGCPVDLNDAIYFGARDTLICSKQCGWLVRARLRLFTVMFRNSVRAVELFNIPSAHFVEVGRELEI